MRKRLLLGLGVVLLASGGGAAWWFLRPPPPPPPAARTYEEIKREEYEAWMRELGYTE